MSLQTLNPETIEKSITGQFPKDFELLTNHLIITWGNVNKGTDQIECVISMQVHSNEYTNAVISLALLRVPRLGKFFAEAISKIKPGVVFMEVN